MGIFKVKPQVAHGQTSPDEFTDELLARVMPPEDRAELRQAIRLMHEGRATEAEAIVDALCTSMRVAMWAAGGPRPVYSTSEQTAMRAALAAIEAEDVEHATAVLAAAGLTSGDLGVGHALHALEWEEAATTPEPPERASEPHPGESEDIPARPAGSDITLPDGFDFTNPDKRKTVEAKVRASHYGEHAVVMWPRYPDVVDGIKPQVPVVNARPGMTEHALDPSTKPTDALRVAASGEANGLGTLVAFDPYGRRAVFAHLDPETAAIQRRFAAVRGCQPHDVEVACHWVFDGRVGARRLDQVVVLRLPERTASVEKRKQEFADLINTLPGGSVGWEVVDDLVSGRVWFRYGQPRVLAKTVPMVDLLPEALDTSDWSTIPLGLDPDGNTASIDLTAGPHALIVGPTGSGKSVFLRQHAASALAHGHALIVIDPIKGGLDFLAFKPWCTAFADDGIEQARVAIEKVYEEGMRRKALQRAYAAPSWIDLPAEVRKRERVQPLTVLFDEFMSAVIASPVPKGLDKDDPLVEEANRINAAKAVILAMVGKIARELRFTGIFLVIAMQRPDASLLAGFGEIRSNLTSAVQLVKPGSLPAQETLRMVFPGDQTQVAADSITELDDGQSKGLATIAAEGGDVTGFRVGFGAPAEIPGLLTRLGIPEAKPWDIEGPDAEPEPFTPITPAPPVVVNEPAPTVTELPCLELTLDEEEFPDSPKPNQPPITEEDESW